MSDLQGIKQRDQLCHSLILTLIFMSNHTEMGNKSPMSLPLLPAPSSRIQPTTLFFSHKEKKDFIDKLHPWSVLMLCDGSSLLSRPYISQQSRCYTVPLDHSEVQIWEVTQIFPEEPKDQPKSPMWFAIVPSDTEVIPYKRFVNANYRDMALGRARAKEGLIPAMWCPGKSIPFALGNG